MIKPVWEQQFEVNTFCVDAGRKLNLLSFFNFFQESAQKHAAHLGFGFTEMEERKHVWALLRVLVEFEGMPAWGEKVIVKTWPTTMTGIFAFRDMQLIGQDGHVYAKGTSMWTILDQHTRRPVKDAHIESLRFNELDSALADRPSKIHWPEKLKVIQIQEVGYTHIDMNGHMNNTRYLDWTINTFPYELMIERVPSKVEINFINETHPGDRLEIAVPEEQDDSDRLLGFIRHANSGKPVYALKIELNKEERK